MPWNQFTVLSKDLVADLGIPEDVLKQAVEYRNYLLMQGIGIGLLTAAAIFAVANKLQER